MNFGGSFCAFVTVLVLAFCVHEGVAIKCFVCGSNTDPKCANPFDNTTIPISDCKAKPGLDHLSEETAVCEKIRRKVNGEWQYFRSCAYIGESGITSEEEGCLMRTGTNNTWEEYCTCNNKDGCNTGPLAYSNYLVILFGAVVTWCVTSSYDC